MILRLREIVPGVLFCGGQPSRAGLEWLAEKGFRVVVSLRRPGEGASIGDLQPREEARICQGLGMSFFSLPVLDLTPPGPREVEAFNGIMRNADGPVFVHCAQGIGRSPTICQAVLSRREKAAQLSIPRVRTILPKIGL